MGAGGPVGHLEAITTAQRVDLAAQLILELGPLSAAAHNPYTTLDTPPSALMAHPVM